MIISLIDPTFSSRRLNTVSFASVLAASTRRKGVEYSVCIICWSLISRSSLGLSACTKGTVHSHRIASYMPHRCLGSQLRPINRTRMLPCILDPCSVIYPGYRLSALCRGRRLVLIQKLMRHAPAAQSSLAKCATLWALILYGANDS